jgi:hypothetical protein
MATACRYTAAKRYAIPPTHGNACMAHSQKPATSNLPISFQPPAFSSWEQRFLRVSPAGN